MNPKKLYSKRVVVYRNDDILSSTGKASENISTIISETQREELSRITEPKFDSRNWRVLYRATRDGFSASSFHQKCDGHSPTLVIVKSDHGNVFGGYNPVQWNIKRGYYKTPGVFIFGFEQNQTKIVKVDYNGKGWGSIWCHSNSGPSFNSDGVDGFCVKDNCDRSYCWAVLDSSRGFPPPEGYDIFFLNGGEGFFLVLDYEVFTPITQEEKDLRTRINLLCMKERSIT